MSDTPQRRQEDKLLKEHKRWQRMYLLMVLAFTFVSIILFLFFLHDRSQIQHQVTEINRALCLRKNQELDSIRVAKQFLRAHPNGTADFSKTFILATIAKSQAVVDSLQDVSCPPPS